MRNILLIFFVGVYQVYAIDSYSQNTKITLELQNVTVADVLEKIEGNSEFYFLYNAKLVDVKREVSISVENEKISDILVSLFSGTGVTYKVYDKQIILTPSELSTLSETLQQQQLIIAGKVTDASSGESMAGVNIQAKGTTLGTITDAGGNYSLIITDTNATLVFSFIGYITQEISLNGRTTIDVTLESEVTGLEEVVVIGYGTSKKSDLTGAVTAVTGDMISERNTTQVSQALQGSMAGVMVTRSNNAPGTTADIRIRGITTIGNSTALIIVDGVPVNDINSINPNDVENISVLKDAASASIYGSRAAAGVILVTTKRAKLGEFNLVYNTEYGIEKPTRIPDYVDPTRYMQIANELRWNDAGNGPDEYPLYSKNLVDNYVSLNAENPDLYPITNWVDLILKKNAPRQSHVLSISAGTNTIRSKLTLAYDKTDALYDGRSYDRISSRFNNDVTINKFLSATLDMYYLRTFDRRPSVDPMFYMLISAPVYAAEWSDGRVGQGQLGNNIYAQLEYGGFNNSWRDQISGKISINVTPLDGLKLSAIVSPNLGFYKSKNFLKKITYTAWNDPTMYLGTILGALSNDLYENRNDNHQITTQFLVNYNKSWGEHSIDLLGGYENYYAYYENLEASRQQYDLNSFPYLDIGPLTFRGNSGNAYENAYRSWFGRFMYNYHKKYLLQGNIRFDGSSRFAPDYRWGYYPSFSAGWVISEESFMQNIAPRSFLKLRASWGTLGNERIGNYPYQATIVFGNALFNQGSNVVSSLTAGQNKYVIKDISWEKTETFDIGLDVGFFDNKLMITGDYYQKVTKDMLLALEIPRYIGFSNPDQNTGKMNTKGWEFETSYKNRTGELSYSVSFNLSDFKSRMGNLGGTVFLGDQIKEKGSEFNEWYGYQSEGLFQTQEEVNNSAKLNASVKPGDVKYKDISGPDGVPDGKISAVYDRVLLGGSLPRYMFGGNIRLDYKGFDFSLVVQGIGKQNIRLQGLMIQPLMENWGHIPKILDGNYWSVYNSDEENQKVKYPRMSQIGNGNNYAMSDYWLINGAYLRVKNIVLGYTLPQNLSQKVKMQNIRLYANISDILTIDKFPKGWDPEVSASGYPITASFLFGVSVKF